jgi:hypothetical protein
MVAALSAPCHLPSMPKRPRKPKREDFNEAAFRVVREATPERPEEPADAPPGWTAPTEEETPPPKIL